MDDPVRRLARERPGALALCVEGRDITYAELDAAADGVARQLVARRVGPGDRVATTLAAGVAFAALLHAAPRIGAVLVPLSARIPDTERSRVVGLAGPALVVDDALGGPEAEVHAAHLLDPDAQHTLLFTSGTTGDPKPVELTYANHAASARASAANLGVEPDDRWLCVLPVHHVGGLAIFLRAALYGTAVVVPERADTPTIKRSLEAGEASIVSLVATQLGRLAHAGLGAAPVLRAALVGGGPVPSELLAWAVERRLPLLQTYGMTETASQIATLAADEALEASRRGSAGRPLAGVEVRIEAMEREIDVTEKKLDTTEGKLGAPERERGAKKGESHAAEAEINTTGEILVRGPMVSRAALSADGWLHTGDRGWLDDDGYLWVEGRLDDVIVTGGENVSATEVEKALLAHPAVAEVAVVGRPDPEWGQAVTAYVVLERDGSPANDAELVAHCRARLAPFKAPKAIHRVAKLPGRGPARSRAIAWAPDARRPRAPARSLYSPRPPTHAPSERSTMAQKLNVQDLSIRSDAFEGHGSIPERHTGDGEDVAPALEWSGVPEGTQAFAVVVHDPDAPLVDGFTHWVAYNIAGDAGGLPEGGEGATNGANSMGNQGYNGPAPPPGHGPHHYYFWVYALDEELDMEAGLDRRELLSRIEDHVIEQARVIGIYEH